ncbi:regulator of chromosome condensation (RCC1), partial [Thraustotheca clavata]
MNHEPLLTPQEPEDHATEDNSVPEVSSLPHLFDIYFFGKAPYLGDDNQQQNLTSSFPPGTNILEISSGYEWTAVLLENHLVYTWGSGQLGHGQDTTVSLMRPTLIASLANIRVVRISCGSTHGGFISETGELYMVGDGRYGRLGTGSSDMALVPVQVHCTYDAVKARCIALGIWPTFLDERGMKRDESTTFADVSCGDRHTLVLVRSMLIIKQAILAFGDGSYGRLGLGTDKDNKDPCLVSCYKTSQGIMFPPIQKIHAGQSHSLAVTHTGEVGIFVMNKLYTWGNGGHGRLGHGSEESYWTPKRVEYFTPSGSV